MRKMSGMRGDEEEQPANKRAGFGQVRVIVLRHFRREKEEKSD
jgi:hypothetical protein